MDKKYFTKINLFGKDIYAKDEDARNDIKILQNKIMTVSSNYAEATSNSPYIGVPEVTSFVQGIVRLTIPGTYLITIKIIAPTVPTKMKTFEYYICPNKRPDDLSFDESKFVRRIVSFEDTRTANACDTVSFVFNADKDVMSKTNDNAPINTIDLLMDAYSYDLTSGDSNVPLNCKMYITRIFTQQ